MAKKKTTAKAKTRRSKTAVKAATKTRKSPKKKATKKKASATTARKKKTSVKDEEVSIDRRRKLRREEEAKKTTKPTRAKKAAKPEQADSEPKAATPPLERRKKVTRRRQIDPTTCERDYSDAEVEFMGALDEYKRMNGRMFPTCSEVLEVLRGIGYFKLTPAELAARNAAEAAMNPPQEDVSGADAESNSEQGYSESNDFQLAGNEQAISGESFAKSENENTLAEPTF